MIMVKTMVISTFLVGCGLDEEKNSNTTTSTTKIEQNDYDEANTAGKEDETDKSEDEKESKQEQQVETTDYFMTVNGVKYTLPFKVSELEEAGFDLSEYKAGEVAGKEDTHLLLKKNDIKYYFHVQNQNNSAANVMDCLVTYVELDVVCYPKSDAVILEEIKYGTEREKVIEVCEKYESRVTECEDGRFIYRIESKSGDSGYKIFVSKEGIVTSFAACNYELSKVFSVEIFKSDDEEITDVIEVTSESETITEVEEEETTPIEDTSKAPELVRFEKTEYENQYKNNKKIKTINIPGYNESYELTNNIYLGSNVVMYLITQNLFEIDYSIFYYDFDGTMNAKNEYCDMGFSFNIGLVENKEISSTEELSCGEKVNVRDYQFSINPGFYNFYNGGMNDFWSNNGTAVIMKTLTPDFNFSQEDNYIRGKDAWVEVKPNDTVRIYVMLGTKDWYNKVTQDIIDLAMEIERQ